MLLTALINSRKSTAFLETDQWNLHDHGLDEYFNEKVKTWCIVLTMNFLSKKNFEKLNHRASKAAWKRNIRNWVTFELIYAWRNADRQTNAKFNKSRSILLYIARKKNREADPDGRQQLLYGTSYFRWNHVLWLAETHHVPVRNFRYWTGPDYGFRQPFCLRRNNERKLLKAAKI